MSIILTDEQNQLWLEAHEKYVMDQASIQVELRLKREAAQKAEAKAEEAEAEAEYNFILWRARNLVFHTDGQN